MPLVQVASNSVPSISCVPTRCLTCSRKRVRRSGEIVAEFNAIDLTSLKSAQDFCLQLDSDCRLLRLFAVRTRASSWRLGGIPKYSEAYKVNVKRQPYTHWSWCCTRLGTQFHLPDRNYWSIMVVLLRDFKLNRLTPCAIRGIWCIASYSPSLRVVIQVG